MSFSANAFRCPKRKQGLGQRPGAAAQEKKKAYDKKRQNRLNQGFYGSLS